MPRIHDITDLNIYRNERRKHKNVRWVLIPAFLVVCMVAGYFFSMSGLFAIRGVELSGNTYLEEEEILGLAGIEIGKNIFTVNDELLEELLPIIPRIKSAQVHRRLPGTVVIKVQEREPVGMMIIGRAALEIDASGRVLDRYTTIKGQALPLITGIDTTDKGLVAGSYITGKGMETATGILTAMKDYGFDIGEVNVSDPDYIKIYSPDGIEIRLGDAEDLEEKYRLYNSIILENQGTGKAIRYIDVSILEKPALSFK